MDTCDDLFLPITDKSKAFQHIAVQARTPYRHNAAIWLHIVQLFVFIDHGLHNGLMRHGRHNLPAVDKPVIFKSNKSLVIQQWRNIPHNLHIGVEVHAAVLLQHDKAHDVGHEGVFFAAYASAMKGMAR